MAGRKRKFSVAADASHPLSIANMSFIKKIAYESVERHRVKSRSHTPGFRPVENFPTLEGLNEQHFHDLRNVEFGIER
jgi:hypothetical protein